MTHSTDHADLEIDLDLSEFEVVETTPSQYPTMRAPYNAETIPSPSCYELDHCSPATEHRTEIEGLKAPKLPTFTLEELAAAAA